MKTFSLEAVDSINQYLDQLSALLVVAQSKDFTNCALRVQTNYLWACYSLTEEIKTTFTQQAKQAQEVAV